MKIFYEKNGNRIGPKEVSELHPLEISPDTLVWHEGMDDWTQAKNIEVLVSYFSATPPPLPKVESDSLYDLNYEKRNDAVGFGILLLLLPILVYLLRGFIAVEIPYYLKISAIVLLQISAMIAVYRIAKEQNRTTDSWLVFSFFVPAVALISIGLSRKLTESNKSKYLQELDQMDDL